MRVGKRAPGALAATTPSLEDRIGVRLFARTTRSVAPTEAGERLLRSLGPAPDEAGRVAFSA